MLSIENLCYFDCGPISLQLESRQLTGLSGASGSGKSQLLRALSDMEPHSGDIALDGVNQQDVPAHQWRKKVAMIPAESVWWYDTVGEHFTTFPLEQLERLGFESDVSGWSISRLSSGEKQRLGLLRAIQFNPEVLLLDEPTANLDANNTSLVETFVKSYLQQSNAASIWVSHDIEQLQRISTQRYQIADGILLLC